MRIWIVAAILILMTGCSRQRPLAHPALTSNVPSIKIALANDDVEFHPVVFEDHETQYCSVVMHNVSSRGVVAYVLSDGGDPVAGIASSREIRGTGDHPSLAPLSYSRKELFTFGQPGRTTPQGFAKAPAQLQQIIVAAAIFTDGSYEGDVHVAAKLRAQQIGVVALYRLITPVIDHVVQDQSMNDEARTARIKDEVFHIPSQPEDAASHSFQSQFPDLPTQEAVADLTEGLDTAKNDLWGDLYGYMHECCQYPPPDHISLAGWWRTRKGIL
jgi:hypothetical protein